MINSNVNALGVIFPNSYDSMVPELVAERAMAAIPFAGRYRMIDFVLSSMVHAGMDNISLVVRKNYHSLMDHLGAGREWDLTRKNGGLSIFPPYAEKNIKVYHGLVEALASILPFLRDQKEEYVVMANGNIAVNFDFAKLIDTHIKSGADVTTVYAKQELPACIMDDRSTNKDMYYSLEIEDGRVNRIRVNYRVEGVQNVSMSLYVIKRHLLIDLIEGAYVLGHSYFERDVLLPRLGELNVQAYECKDYFARITDMKSYFDENMKLLDEANLDGLFAANPVYTKIRDDNPTRYIAGASAKNIMAADGCVIEGEVENSVLFRGVKIGKGAKVKNCVLMQDTVVEAGANIEYVISDKNVVISAGKEVKGTDTFPVFVEKYKTV